MKPYTISRATEVTGVPENKIVDAVHTYATNGPAYICWGVGGGDQHGYNATNSGLAKTILRILTGNIDNYGGEYLGDPGLLNEEGIKDFAVRDAELVAVRGGDARNARRSSSATTSTALTSWKGFEPIDECYRKMWDIPRPMLHQMVVTPPKAWDAILNEDPYPVKAHDLLEGLQPLAGPPTPSTSTRRSRRSICWSSSTTGRRPRRRWPTTSFPQPTRSNVPWPPPARTTLTSCCAATAWWSPSTSGTWTTTSSAIWA